MTLPAYLTCAQLPGYTEQASLPEDAWTRVAANRAYLDTAISSGNTFYGINTGFGSLCDVRIKGEELEKLQENLVRSHACGMGHEVPEEIVRLMLLLKIQGLSQGQSGVRPELIQQLLQFYNLGITPVVYELGSLGASGDLAPLAHLSLPIFGAGEVWYNGSKMPAAEVLKLAGLQPLHLAAKEGLALLNGTQFMSGYLSHCLLLARRLSHWANCIAALSADAYLAKASPYHPTIHTPAPPPRPDSHCRPSAPVAGRQPAAAARQAAGTRPLLLPLHTPGAWRHGRCAGPGASRAGDRN